MNIMVQARLFKNTDLIFCVKNYFLEFEILASGTENFKKKICFHDLYRLTGCREKTGSRDILRNMKISILRVKKRIDYFGVTLET